MELLLNSRMMPFLTRAICQALDGGGGPGKLALFDAKGGTLLAVVRFSYPCQTSSIYEADAVVFKNFAAEENAPARGKVKWAVAMDSEDNIVFECDAGGEKDKVVVKLDEENIRRGDIVRVLDFRLRLRQTT